MLHIPADLEMLFLHSTTKHFHESIINTTRNFVQITQFAEIIFNKHLSAYKIRQAYKYLH